MKKILLATTALVAASAFTAPAFAAERIQLQLRGYFVGGMAYTDVDTSSDENPINFGSDSEIHFRGFTTLDNGLEVGFFAELELEADAAAYGGGTKQDTIDEVYIQVQGGFGRIQFGQQDGAMFQQDIDAPNVFVGHGVSQRFGNVRMDPFAPYNFGASSQLGVGNPIDATAHFTSDFIKIIYFTPEINGLQFGFSYTPNPCRNNTGYAGCVLSSSEFGRNFWEGSFAWEFALSNMMVGLSGGYGQGESSGSGIEPREWNVGADVEFGGFTIGASMANKELGGSLGTSNEQTHWDAGVTYETGPWGFGVQYGNLNGDANWNGTENEEFYSWLGGVTYMYGPGMQVGFGIQTLDVDDGGTYYDEDATSVFVENSMSF